MTSIGRILPTVVVIGSLCVAGLASTAAADTAATAARPNILVFLADDLGWRDVPWHGCEYAMPHLDALAKESVKLESHYVHPSAITTSPDGLMRLNPTLATNPKDPRDRAALAPEVLRANGPGNARATVFAVGAMLYEAVTGSPVGPASAVASVLPVESRTVNTPSNGEPSR